jgi:hypothetical protein
MSFGPPSVRIQDMPIGTGRLHDRREPVREHDRLAAAVWGCGEQFERAAALGLRAACGVNRLSASRPFCSGGEPARWVVSCAYIRWTP